MMDIATLVIVGLVLILLLAFLLTLFLKARNRQSQKREAKKETMTKTSKGTTAVTMQTLIKSIKDKNSSKFELKNALDTILQQYGEIGQNSATNEKYDFQTYEEVLITMCNHPQTNKDIILQFNRALEKLNPSYKKDINNAVTKGLNARV